jgi:hypothetical protein
MGLKDDILEASERLGIDPYHQAFKPSDLGLNSNKYGSFSDYCAEDETISGKWSSDVILKVAERNKGGKPYKYLLIR